MFAGYPSCRAGKASLAALLSRFAHRLALFRRTIRRRRELAALIDAEERLFADIGITRLDLIEALSAGRCRDPLPRLRRARAARRGRPPGGGSFSPVRPVKS